MDSEDPGVRAVRRYYECVDDGDVEALVAMFSPDAVYARPGYESMRGRSELTAFYRESRVIAHGRHELDTVVSDGTTVAVHGVFEGELRTGERVTVRFADFFVVGVDGRFTRRDTFFFAPSV